MPGAPPVRKRGCQSDRVFHYGWYASYRSPGIIPFLFLFRLTTHLLLYRNESRLEGCNRLPLVTFHADSSWFPLPNALMPAETHSSAILPGATIHVRLCPRQPCRIHPGTYRHTECCYTTRYNCSV